MTIHIVCFLLYFIVDVLYKIYNECSEKHAMQCNMKFGSLFQFHVYTLKLHMYILF